MGRIVGMALFAVVLWASAELYTKGPTEAFGGVLAGVSDPDAAETRNRHHAIERTERAVDAFQRAYDTSLDRVEKGLADTAEN